MTDIESYATCTTCGKPANPHPYRHPITLVQRPEKADLPRNQWQPKGLIEHLSRQRTFAPDPHTRQAITNLIGVLRLHRPTGSNGKHGSMHTLTCGCEDAA